ncbi:CU044_5270 family protein [Actinomadura livida]|uniref:CU044_5270 family protein n=1 Tax=Actinomadura livida TaxID=79909 RepID=A0A7W7I7W0_9ACTN|nr:MULTISPECIES: CU044_5270 family protein [Actinomadura]MBB4772142.1 hypothetical protein [Actinomadura catellatispora]GGU37595.1 hypothetical protein GCM10010208_72620 [Actinomadura livida]
MNDVLRTLSEARPDELNPDAPVGHDVRRMELARAMTAGDDTAARGKRRRVRPVWALGLAGAVAAGALVAVTVIPAGTGPAGDPGGGQAVDAKTVLLAAAERADGQPDTVRAYWYRVLVASHTHTVGSAGARYTIVTREREESWMPSEPGVKAWSRHRYLGAKPATEADAEAWRRAGSPRRFEVALPIAPGSKIAKPRTVFEAGAGPVRSVRGTPMVDGNKIYWIGHNVTMREVQSLPADPERLKAELMRWYDGRGTEGGGPARAEMWLYNVAQGLVMELPVRPRVRAAAFRMLAGLPSVKSLGRVRDPRGRAGDAVAVDRKTPGGVVRHRMIIDSSTGTALATENIMLNPKDGKGGPAGRAMSSVVTLTAEWTDSGPR